VQAINTIGNGAAMIAAPNNQQVAQQIMYGSNGVTGAVQAGQNGNAQQLINMTAQGAGGVIGGNTGMTLQNVGGQVAITGGQIQNG